MRIASGRRRTEKTIRKIAGVAPFRVRPTVASLILILALCVNFSCAGKKPSFKHVAPRAKTPQKIEREKIPETGAKKEIIRTEQKPLATNATPKARASAKMVEDGKIHLSSGNFPEAERSFQEAINVDPSNGIAYYFLAKTKFEKGELAQANGILDKAEVLLAGSAEWSEIVSTLRGLIGEKL